MAEMKEYIIFFLVWLVSAILIRTLLKKRSSARLPPSPLALPIIGHLHLLTPPVHQSLAKLSSRYGSLICVYLGSVPCIVASSPEMAKKLLKTYESFFSNRPHTVANDYITYGSQDFAYAPYGPYWNFMKKLCTSQLLGGQTLYLLQPVRRHEIEQFIEFLARKAYARKSVNMGSELIRYTNNVISRIIMSERCSGDEDEAGAVRKLIEDTAELLGKFNFSDYIWFCKKLDLQGFGRRLKQVRDRFDDIMEKIIDEHQNKRRKSKEGIKDLLDILLDIAEDPSSEIKLTRDNIKAVIMVKFFSRFVFKKNGHFHLLNMVQDLFAAGTDTTARTMEWALAELINHPNIMKNVVQEIESVVGNSRVVKESDILNLPYLEAVVKETLRLHPGAAIIHRESSEACIVAGYHIPAKVPVLVNVWAIGRDPNHWENALEFRPERFLCEDGSGKGQLDVRGQHYHFLPFGSGRRGCPGSSLAMMTIQTTLAALIQYFEFKIEGGKESVDMEEGSGLSLPRANPLICIPVARFYPTP